MGGLDPQGRLRSRLPSREAAIADVYRQMARLGYCPLRAPAPAAPATVRGSEANAALASGYHRRDADDGLLPNAPQGARCRAHPAATHLLVRHCPDLPACLSLLHRLVLTL